MFKLKFGIRGSVKWFINFDPSDRFVYNYLTLVILIFSGTPLDADTLI